MPDNGSELLKQFRQEFRALQDDRQPVILELTKLHAWSPLSEIQLALRHPQNRGPTSDIVRKLAEALQAKAATTPALAEVARRGWQTSKA